MNSDRGLHTRDQREVGGVATRQPFARGRVMTCARLAWTSILMLGVACTSVTQRPDLDFEPPMANATYPPGRGPVVGIDAAHQNFHTAKGRYQTFAKLVTRAGFQVRSFEQTFTKESLSAIDILVISNALNEANVRKWELPTPSAFSPDEIRTLREWVAAGGALLLIADHMPFPGAAEDLANEFGFIFMNGYASAQVPETQNYSSKVRYDREQGTLLDHVITAGAGDADRIDHVVTFGGQAFRLTEAARKRTVPLLRLPMESRLSLPWRAGRFDRKTAVVPAGEWLQGAVMELERGRVAVFGEAAMFSAQRLETRRRGKQVSVRAMGMNDPDAADNPQFALNVMRWLAEPIHE